MSDDEFSDGEVCGDCLHAICDELYPGVEHTEGIIDSAKQWYKDRFSKEGRTRRNVLKVLTGSRANGKAVSVTLNGVDGAKLTDVVDARSFVRPEPIASNFTITDGSTKYLFTTYGVKAHLEGIVGELNNALDEAVDNDTFPDTLLDTLREQSYNITKIDATANGLKYKERPFKLDETPDQKMVKESFEELVGRRRKDPSVEIKLDFEKDIAGPVLDGAIGSANLKWYEHIAFVAAVFRDISSVCKTVVDKDNVGTKVGDPIYGFDALKKEINTLVKDGYIYSAKVRVESGGRDEDGELVVRISGL